MFSYLEDEEQYYNQNIDNNYFDLTTNPIIWGKGTVLLNGQNWADILGY